MFLWPKREPWPVCPIHGDIPYVAALQLRKEDVPELGFPPGTDLFQLLWCPEQHNEDNMFCPKPAVYWRKRSAVKQALAAAPAPAEVEYGHFPRPCALYPERVTEYPDPFELEIHSELNDSPILRTALEAVQRIKAPAPWHHPTDGGSHLYQTWLSTAEGTKVGGYPDWVQDPGYPGCGCGKTMEHLLSFASWEYDGVTWGRWLPIEDRLTLDTKHAQHEAVGSPHNCMFGDAGNMYVFVCRNHREPHIRASMQCS
jgi:hypothetical protein